MIITVYNLFLIFLQELDLLGLLYGLFQKFIAFDGQFRDRLWADADLPKANKEVTTMLFITLF